MTEELIEAVFRAGHCDGWTGNQNRRDVQMVDATKSWLLLRKMRPVLDLRNAAYAAEQRIKVLEEALGALLEGLSSGATVNEELFVRTFDVLEGKEPK